MSLPIQYQPFGEMLGQARLRAGFSKQADLALALGVSQQTVSRWEKGVARPRLGDFPALESVLAVRDDHLRAAAGYAPASSRRDSESSTSFDRALPLNALSPDEFESFCAALLDRTYRSKNGRAQRYGAQGHDQRGIDILVSGPFGEHTFQCKRVEEFGAQKVHTVVAQDSYPAPLKVLLLSNVASPKARDAMRLHPGWELWDREDITRQLHSLPRQDRIELVDVYFSGQRFDLLGEMEPGPFQSLEAFFKPYSVEDRLFNHTWPLTGRRLEVDQALEALQDVSVVLTVLSGAPGAGKTRVAKEVCERLEALPERFRVVLVAPNDEVKSQHLDKLGQPTVNTVLVVDDAHERDDLAALLRFAAIPGNRTRLFLTMRPYGKEELRLQAAEMSLSAAYVRFVDMEPQSEEQALALTKSILEKIGASVASAEAIAKATQATPLITVLAAQLVSRNQVPLEKLADVADLRAYVLSCFQDVISGTLAVGQDSERVLAILRVVALVQPVIADDPNLLSLLANLEGVAQPDATKLIRRLAEAGVLVKRGQRSRIAPDLLADEVLRSNYVKPDGTADARVLAVFNAASPVQLKNLVVNLGRLDWRLRDGKPDESRLLESLVPHLAWSGEYSNPHLDAVAAVAYYQPRLALNFASKLIEEGHGGNSSVTSMLRSAAFTYDHLEEACSLLWRAGRENKRGLSQTPGHGVRVLKELAEFQPNKPIAYVKSVVDFALDLLKRPISTSYPHTPFEVLEAPLEPEMESITSNYNTMTIHRSDTPLEQVREVREHVVSALLSFIATDPPRRAFLAARTISHALRGPMHGDPEGAWCREHVRVLVRLGEVLPCVVSPVVLLGAVESAAWHAFHGFPETKVLAAALIELLERDLPTRFMRQLVDGWGVNTWPLDKSLERTAHVSAREALIVELRAEYPDRGLLAGFIGEQLKQLFAVAGDGHGAPHLLVNRLIAEIDGLASEVVQRGRSKGGAVFLPYVGQALSVLIEQGGDGRVDSILSEASNSDDAMRQVAEAYSRFVPNRAYTSQEVALFRRIFASKDATVLFHAANLVLQVSKRSPALGVELIGSADFTVNEHATNSMFTWLSHGDPISWAEVQPQLAGLLSRLVAVPEIDDYWFHRFLKQAVQDSPELVVDFVMRRLEEADEQGWKYTPLRWRNNQDGLNLLTFDGGAKLLRQLLDWAIENLSERTVCNRLGEVVIALCGEFGESLQGILLKWLQDGDAERSNLVASVLTAGPNTLVFEARQFVHDLLGSAELLGLHAVREIRGALWNSAVSGVRSGTFGEPFPEDVRMLNESEKILQGLSRADPAYELYEQLQKEARRSIERVQARVEASRDEFDE